MPKAGFFFFKAVLGSQQSLRGRHRAFSHTLCLHMGTASPVTSITHQTEIFFFFLLEIDLH